jgi:hypothetical protein
VTASGWRELRSEHLALYSPIGLRLIDDFTGRAPLGRVSARLDLEVSAGVWAPAGLDALLTPSSVLAWPGLGRHSEPALIPARRYRARVEAERYRPDYLQGADGVEFDAPAWDDQYPPAPITTGPTDLYLFPSTAYDFPTWVPVLRGAVEEITGGPVANVLVHQGAAERTLTDERGTFSLPLRWATSGLVVDAVDIRTGRTGSHLLSLPADLRTNVTITIV